MDNDKFNQYFEFMDEGAAAYSKIGVINDSVDLINSKLSQIEREIDCNKPMLQSCRDKYENIETEICNARQLQRKAQFVLDNVRSEEENLHESFRNLRLNYEMCVEKSGGYQDPNETIRVKINEVTTLRKNLMEELLQLRKKLDDDGKKLVRVKAMITEQEKKNVAQLRKLKEISESAVPISLDVKKRIDTVLSQEINEGDDVLDDDTMQ
ncbi:uncharacterized protein LOC105200472 isoform X2 [Solenopsis invicta]|uniref:uncharacterized protein LOC105200472 isoform X2 n=1 Tax=Solenopsis invicta TaxID=13686 RepID=UPI0005958CED|nr:uncharacterized protein LOC105200472 isoform X2 [Solenopsis invicta]